MCARPAREAGPCAARTIRARDEKGTALSTTDVTTEEVDGMATTTAVVDAPSSDSSPSFAELGVRPEIVTALAERGITHTFAIQELTLPLALAGSDLIGQARTGMGKTYGFGVPLLHRIATG